MQRYTTLFLDLDNTLLDFKAAEIYSFFHTCRQHGIAADDALLAEYQRINDAYWEQLEQGAITKPELLRRRFGDLFALREITGIDPVAFNQEYLDNLALHTVLIDGADAVCRALSQTHALYLATNGVSRTQRRRLAATPLGAYVQGVIVSEDAGHEKPDPAYFRYALEKCGIADPATVLMVGDSLTADVAGGAASGLDTCWFNPAGKPVTGPAVPTYIIHALSELPPLLERLANH